MYSDDNWRRATLTLDFKFPCPETNEPQWRRYREDSAYFGSTQAEIYEEALGSKAMMLSPKGFSR